MNVFTGELLILEKDVTFLLTRFYCNKEFSKTKH